MADAKIDVWAAPETNLPWTPKIRNIIQRLGRKKFYTFKVEGTSSTEGSIGNYQPGGVGLLARGDIVGHISNEGSNARGLGRWSHLVFNGQYGKRIWILAGYR
eukprot:7349277-Ditylum_brightwellii.AAC.1